jgi:tetratricopeptide (TPR) repeat protein
MQRDFLVKALRFYQDYARLNGDQPAVRDRTATAFFRVGRIQYKLGRYTEAQEAYENALGEYSKLSGKAAIEADLQLTRADVYNHLHLVHRDAGIANAAQDACGKAIQLLEALTAFPLPDTSAKQDGRPPLTLLGGDLPRPHRYHYALAQCRNNLGALLRKNGNWRDAEQSYVKALKTWTLLAAEFPGVAEVVREEGIGHANLAIVLHEMNQAIEAESHFQQAADLQNRLVGAIPRVPLFWDDLAITLQGQAHLLAKTGRAPDAEAADLKVLAIREKLATDYPRMPDYRRRLALALHNYGSLLSQLGRWTEAEGPLRRGLPLQEKLVEEVASSRDYRFDLAVTHNALGLVLRETN